MTTAAVPAAAKSDPHARRKSIVLVFCCTVLGAAAQILLKTGANQLAHPSPVAMLTNVALLGGLSFYGVSTVLLVLALKDGELSLLYPVIALTYVWVTLLSLMVFHDRINPVKFAGIAIIVLGVAVMGRGQKS